MNNLILMSRKLSSCLPSINTWLKGAAAGSILVFSSGAFAEEKLIFAIDLIRHGDRTPINASPEMNKVWPYGKKQLTPKGMHQAYELGEMLRKRYVSETKLLPEQYDINSMYVRSSGSDRTLMTAQSILLGLYPLGSGPKLNKDKYALPQGVQPIPIYTMPREQDDLLVHGHDKVKYKSLLETHIFPDPAWAEKDKLLKPNYARWSKVLGSHIDALYDLIHIADRLYIESLYDIPRPKGLDSKDHKTITDAGYWAFLQVLNHPRIAQATGTKLADTIKNEFKLAVEQNRPLKYILFVAHDTTLSIQLNLLGQNIGKVPPYTADIQYSLYDVGDAKHEVEVTYNQKPLYIKACGGTRCSFDTFLSLFKAVS